VKPPQADLFKPRKRRGGPTAHKSRAAAAAITRFQLQYQRLLPKDSLKRPKKGDP
jgi:hypothetical protein